MRTIRLIGITLVTTCAALVACERRPKPPEVKRADPLWSEYVSSHTSGLVSKASKIQIQFTSDLFPEDQVGKSAGEVLEFEPKIPGRATVASRREIVVVPDDPLKPGQYYLVRLKADRIGGIPMRLGPYEFFFQVIPPGVELHLTGLMASTQDDREMDLQGYVQTSDVEDAKDIIRLLTVRYLGQAMDVSWQHDLSGKRHEFVVKGIERQGDDSTLEVDLDGRGIGVDRSDKQELNVPARDAFEVTEVAPVDGEPQHVRVTFSDRLDSEQNLRGLVTLGDKAAGRALTTRVEANVIRVYPTVRITGKATLLLEEGIRNARGIRLKTKVQREVTFSSQKPQVRFVGRGNILPDAEILKIPFETINVHSVQVTAFQVFENNMAQFLQVNRLDGDTELARVGRFLWRKTMAIPSITPDTWQPFDLDATQLVRSAPGGMVRLTLSINRGNTTYGCSEEEKGIPVAKEEPLKNNEDLYVRESSSWDYAETYSSDDSEGNSWYQREDPCKDAYYKWGNGTKDAANFIASNLGLSAKRDPQGRMRVVVTNLRTAEPLGGVQISLRNFQDQVLAAATSDGDGMADVENPSTPFYLVARKGSDVGYLKLNAGMALPVSHFDVGGQEIQTGIKGMIYGERDVWRPGDSIHLVLAIEDPEGRLPADHPATLRFFNPRGQLVQTITHTSPVGGFYHFEPRTAEDAPTGTWSAQAELGDRLFTRNVKVETIVPNRLKVELRVPNDTLQQDHFPASATIFAEWLHGATADGLKADVSLRLAPATTRFDRFSDFVFDDPTRSFKGEPQTLFEGNLDSKGFASVEIEFSPDNPSAGKMQANLVTRVFEPGGAFSSEQKVVSYHPYSKYVGLKLPKGDLARGMLLTDKKHAVSVASVVSEGRPVSMKQVELKMYKIQWKWWWDKSGESLANYESATHTGLVSEGKISTKDGQGQWEFEVKYPDWGRYLIRACDAEGGHCTGRILYIDWPGWAGRAREESGAGANVLDFFSDKTSYLVGEEAVIQLPDAASGRALLSVETGSRILNQKWIELGKKKSKIDLPITSEMSPTAYISIALIQPHERRDNDRPIRLYGVIPIGVVDPETVLEPLLQSADEWEPQRKVEVRVAERRKRPMTYTLAVVDEGLLGLTGFKTPDLHSHFYAKEALGIRSWDLFDSVVGAYSGELQRLLALGGDADAGPRHSQEGERRFPPVVRFFGPFRLESKRENRHEIDLPNYIGAVRVMVVAGEKGAYGSAEKTVRVIQPLAILTTLPRVIGPDEEFSLPVNVLVSEKKVRDVTLRIQADPIFKILGPDTLGLKFEGPGEQLGFFRIGVQSQIGRGKIAVSAGGAGLQAHSDTSLEVRSPNPSTVRQIRHVVQAGERWQERVIPHGISGTNTVSVEVSTVPAIDLERRLRYLIQYPHGCLEQTTSSVFPQLYLPDLVRLEPRRKEEIERNIKAGIERIRRFQVQNGGFVYWPEEGTGAADSWVTTYAGHFLVEAQARGYSVPPEVLADWFAYQKLASNAWIKGSAQSELDQAYRLYSLSVAGKPELGAMNRLRESEKLPEAAGWQLAAAYQLAGQSDAAHELVRRADVQPAEHHEDPETYGSRLRDRAIVLNSLAVLGEREQGVTLGREIAAQLSAESWHSTQTIAYSLMAIARFYGVQPSRASKTFALAIGTGPESQVDLDQSIFTTRLETVPTEGQTISVRSMNDAPFYATITVSGVPPSGEEKAEAHGLELRVNYTDKNREPMSISRLRQGTDALAFITVRNETPRKLENIALSHMVPAGWEIHNFRLENDEEPGLDYQDIRDDRIYSYFSLEPGGAVSVRAKLTATYAGRYYLPAISAEAMYDAEKRAQTEGAWVTVEPARN